MNKKFKRILAAALAAITMTTAMTLNASATETRYWAVRYVPNSSGVNVSRCEITFLAKSSSSVVTESCTSYTSSVGDNGRIAKVRYWAYVTDINGNVIAGGFSSRYHEAVQTNKNIELSETLYKNQRLNLAYVLEQPSPDIVSCNMSGNIEFYGDVGA